jgi:hypothetical protein
LVSGIGDVKLAGGTDSWPDPCIEFTWVPASLPRPTNVPRNFGADVFTGGFVHSPADVDVAVRAIHRYSFWTFALPGPRALAAKGEIGRGTAINGSEQGENREDKDQSESTEIGARRSGSRT